MMGHYVGFLARVRQPTLEQQWNPPPRPDERIASQVGVS
jgi:hypothetical protein